LYSIADKRFCHQPFNGDVTEPRQAVRHDAQQEPLGGERNGYTGQAAEQRKEKALGQQLLHQARFCSSQRLTNGYLASSGAGARWSGPPSIGDYHFE
jgi:hypothetical protein